MFGFIWLFETVGRTYAAPKGCVHDCRRTTRRSRGALRRPGFLRLLPKKIDRLTAPEWVLVRRTHGACRFRANPLDDFVLGDIRRGNDLHADDSFLGLVEQCRRTNERQY